MCMFMCMCSCLSVYGFVCVCVCEYVSVCWSCVQVQGLKHARLVFFSLSCFTGPYTNVWEQNWRCWEAACRRLCCLRLSDVYMYRAECRMANNSVLFNLEVRNVLLCNCFLRCTQNSLFSWPWFLIAILSNHSQKQFNY